ncbi:hypothetical protein ACFYNL_35800 [Streptomyces sp. NPDC007808]|uniref:hypothetical protein n=1 Tax=Streptomyces sp. NPDC007808 TaxID=3364779 RepID=UPI0036B1C30D
MTLIQFFIGLTAVSFLGLSLLAWKLPDQRKELLKLMGSIIGVSLLGLLVSSAQGIRW